MTWSSKPTRTYRVLTSADVTTPQPPADSGLGVILPAAGDTTTTGVPGPVVPHRFFLIEARKPLP